MKKIGFRMKRMVDPKFQSGDGIARKKIDENCNAALVHNKETIGYR